MTDSQDTGDMTHSFAAELVNIGSNIPSEADLRQIKALILDYSGVAFGGALRPWIVALHNWAERYDTRGTARVVGTTLRVPSEIAAFVNGAAGHSFELDDTHDSSMSHPGAVIIPTAIAVGAETGGTGAQITAAIIAGYETMARLGIAARAERVIAAGYHPTALFGAFGATTAAAKLYDLSAVQLAGAWGHALSLTGGSMQFSQEATGAEIKRLHAGYAARNGVLAAQMTLAGISAPHRSLDGRYGFLALYGQDPDPVALLRQGSRGWAIHDISIKPYACCRLLHSMIDGLRTVTAGFGPAIDNIAAITVRGPRKLVEQHLETRPKTSMAAQYSLPYTVGATLAYGPERFDAYDVANLEDNKILSWAEHIKVEADDDLEASYPAHFGTEVDITFVDGSRRIERVLDSIGTPANPMDQSALRAKAKALAAAHLDNEAFGRLLDTIDALPTAFDVARLQENFVPCL